VSELSSLILLPNHSSNHLKTDTGIKSFISVNSRDFCIDIRIKLKLFEVFFVNQKRWFLTQFFVSAILLFAGSLAYASGSDFYWKNSYFRPIGVPQVQYCTDSTRSIDAALCYKATPAGTNCNGTNSCVDNCPSGFSAAGALLCQKDGPLTYIVGNYTLPAGTIPGVGGGGNCKTTGGACRTEQYDCVPGTKLCKLRTTCDPVVTRCDPITQTCPGGKNLSAGLCYDSCRSGYSNNAMTCTESCRDGYSLTGLSCNQNQPTTIARKITDRGVGTIPALICTNGLVNDAGLCYQPCKPSYKGIATTCWGEAPSGYIACGAGFAKNATICGTLTASQTFAAVMLLGTPACAAIDVFFGNSCSQADNKLSALYYLQKAGSLSPGELAATSGKVMFYLPRAFTILGSMNSLYGNWFEGTFSGKNPESVNGAIMDIVKSPDFKTVMASGNEISRSMGLTVRSPVAGMTDQEIALLTVRSFTDMMSMSMAIAGLYNPALVNSAWTASSKAISVVSAFSYPTYEPPAQ